MKHWLEKVGPKDPRATKKCRIDRVVFTLTENKHTSEFVIIRKK